MSDAAPAGAARTADLYAVVGEYDSPEAVTAAARAAREAGFTRTEAYTPYMVEGLDEELGHKPTRLGWIVLLMGITGGLGGFLMQWYANTQFYPLNIGGKPLNSWPNFIVITFEMTVLLSAFTAGLFMLGRNGLPRLYHSIFNTPGFENATRDGFFLAIEADDPRFDAGAARSVLETAGATRVSDVER